GASIVAACTGPNGSGYSASVLSAECEHKTFAFANPAGREWQNGLCRCLFRGRPCQTRFVVTDRSGAVRLESPGGSRWTYRRVEKCGVTKRKGRDDRTGGKGG